MVEAATDLKYMHGMGNHHETEVLEGALPMGRNSPAKCPYGLIAEQFSGTPFTYARARNQRSWLYKIKPSCKHSKIASIEGNDKLISTFNESDPRLHISPQQYRWKAI
jgi:homogentisate 1,2-dioxygenase